LKNKGLVHIYCGDGKGKTTAAIGLAVRCSGSGGKVLLCQFLKDGSSGEISALKQFHNIQIADFYRKIKFTYMMTEKEFYEAKNYYIYIFENLIKRVNSDNFDLLILDEIIPAINKGYISIEKIIDFLENKPYGLEVVLTGRNPDERLCDLADYISDIIKIKHPFDKGIGARKFIEK